MNEYYIMQWYESKRLWYKNVTQAVYVTQPYTHPFFLEVSSATFVIQYPFLLFLLLKITTTHDLDLTSILALALNTQHGRLWSHLVLSQRFRPFSQSSTFNIHWQSLLIDFNIILSFFFKVEDAQFAAQIRKKNSRNFQSTKFCQSV